VLLNTLTTDTQISLTNLTAIQTGMGLDVGATASTINTIVGNELSLSNQLGTAYKGSNNTNNAVTGTLVAPAGVGAQFDVTRSAGVYTLVQTPGASPAPYNYQKGDRLKILGTALGGSTPANDVNILITATGTGNDIDSFTYTGTSISGGATYLNVGHTGYTGSTGSGFQINVIRTGGTGAYSSINLIVAGSNYLVTEQVTFAGTLFGGASPANDIVLQIDSVAPGGDVVTFSVVGTPVGASGDQTYNGVAAANVAHLGSGAEFNITRTTGTYSATINQAGTLYEEGNTITVLGTTLDGATTANDATITVTGITGGGLIDTISISGLGYAGDSITVYPTMAISEPITGNIPAGTEIGRAHV
jgi:hypothetical protein